MSIGHQLTRIAGALEGAYDFQRVVIAQQVRGFSCSTRSNFWYFFPEWLTSWICSWVPQYFREENRDTIGYFYKVFGTRRIEVISECCNLNIPEKYRRGQSLTRKDVRQLFLSLSEVYREDVYDLFMKVKGERKVEGEIDVWAKRELRAIRGRNFTALTKEQWDLLYARLVPFETIKSIFLNQVPTFGFSSTFDGSEEMRRKRIFLCEKIRRKGLSFNLNKWKAWVAKSMLKRNKQKMGLVIPGPIGHYEVYGQLEWGGASLLLLKGLEWGVDSIVKAHGTRTSIFSSDFFTSKDAILSVLDDFGTEVGLKGYEAIEQSLLYLLGSQEEKPDRFDRQYQGLPAEGFRRRGLKGEKFDVSSFSLGCAQMQHFIQSHPDLFSEAFFMCAPGISEEKCIDYANVTNGPVMTYAIEFDDRVNRAGQCNLGYWGDPRKVKLLVFRDVKISREKLAEDLKKPPLLPEKVFWVAMEFFKAFLWAHVRHTSIREGETNSLDDYESFEMTDYSDGAVLTKVLSNDDWEDARIYLRGIWLSWTKAYREQNRSAKARLQAIKKKISDLIPSFLQWQTKS